VLRKPATWLNESDGGRVELDYNIRLQGWRPAGMPYDPHVLYNDFKDGFQQVCLMVHMYYNLIICYTISDVDNQWQTIN